MQVIQAGGRPDRPCIWRYIFLGKRRCRDSGELSGCAEREGSSEGEDEGAGEVYDEGGGVLRTGRGSSGDTERELRERIVPIPL